MTTNTRAPHHAPWMPLGYRADFAFSPEMGLTCGWHLGLPQIDSPRDWRKFFVAYTEARDDFLGEVATILGGSVLVADRKGGGSPARP